MRKHILIVDDSAVVRKAMRDVLEEEGWEVSGEAADGREGIEKAQQLKPDVIVIDFSMPVMNGIEAARELTRLFPFMPLLMFTNFEDESLEREARLAGFTSVVSKAASIEVLVRNVRALVEPCP